MSFLNSLQLKQKVRNKAMQLDNVPPAAVMQNVAIEHFIRRLAASQYRDNFIIKGGVLISSLVGVNNRTTMDLDTTIKNLQLSAENLKQVLFEIESIDLNDGFTFSIGKIEQIREEADYSGIRIHMTAFFDRTRQPFQLDISTADIITPHEIDYALPSLFAEPISVKAYPLETILAEKLETILSRDIANTRMRDFYDIGILFETKGETVNYETLFRALKNTATKRGSAHLLNSYDTILTTIQDNEEMQRFWNNYVGDFPYAQKYTFAELCDVARTTFEKMFNLEKQADSVASLITNAKQRSEDLIYEHTLEEQNVLSEGEHRAARGKQIYNPQHSDQSERSIE